jgi:hypothetical protein
MKGAVIRLALVSSLFACWLGYLAYLVSVTPREPVILCRPQFLVAGLVGKMLRVPNLSSCGPLRDPRKTSSQKDFTEPGPYILPLRKPHAEGNQVIDEANGDPTFDVAATPPAPGYPAVGPPMSGPPRIYRATPEARLQLGQIKDR